MRYQDKGKYKLAISIDGKLQTSQNKVKGGIEEFNFGNLKSINEKSYVCTIYGEAEPQWYVACNKDGTLYARKDLTEDCYWTVNEVK